MNQAETNEGTTVAHSRLISGLRLVLLCFLCQSGCNTQFVPPELAEHPREELARLWVTPLYVPSGVNNLSIDGHSITIPKVGGWIYLAPGAHGVSWDYTTFVETQRTKLSESEDLVTGYHDTQTHQKTLVLEKGQSFTLEWQGGNLLLHTAW